jgi:hypothetical protein
MIVGVPSHYDLHETATGWMNLAWSLAIDEAINFQEFEYLFDEIRQEHGPDKAKKEIEKHWRAKNLKLNNSISLLQQSLEIFLKAKIAEISPFLLIAGEPQSWPSVNISGQIDFSEFKTIDAIHLPRAAKIVSSGTLSDDFFQIYARLRQHRNKIIHLNASSMKAEVGKILTDILNAHKSLFPGEEWILFRKRYLDSTEEYADKEGIYTGDDYTNNRICSELDAALAEVSPAIAKTIFRYDKKKKSFSCPGCLEQRADTDEEWRFAQIRDDKTIRCAACLSVFTLDEYKKKIVQYFSYLGEDEQAEIANETEKELRG